MEITVIDENEDNIPVGSIMNVKRINPDTYKCLWGTKNGDYIVIIPKKVCEVTG